MENQTRKAPKSPKTAVPKDLARRFLEQKDNEILPGRKCQLCGQPCEPHFFYCANCILG